MANVPGKSPFDGNQSSSSLVFEEFVPPLAWTEDSTCHYLLVDLPGFKRQELKLQVDNQTHLLVSGERQVRENKYKRFEQSFQLPKNIDIEKITGKLEGEILYILVPKKVEQQHQEIKHDSIPSPPPVSSSEDKSDSDESDNKDGKEDDEDKSDSDESDNKDDEDKSDADGSEDESDNKDGENDLERKKHIMRFDEYWGQEADMFQRLAIEKLKNNKGIVVAAIFAFSLAVLVTLKF